MTSRAIPRGRGYRKAAFVAVSPKEGIGAHPDPRSVSTENNRGRIDVKTKIFTGNGDAALLEGELNEWLEKNPYITVKTIKQSYVASDERLFAMISLWYDK